MEWPDEVQPDIAELLRRIDLEVREDEDFVTPDLTINYPPKD